MIRVVAANIVIVERLVIMMSLPLNLTPRKRIGLHDEKCLMALLATKVMTTTAFMRNDY